MKIGDLFWGIAVDDKGFAADLTKKAGKAGDQAGATLGQRMSGGFKKAGSGMIAGLGLGAGVAAFSALDTAISKTIGFFGDAVAAAREDQASIAGLTASLKANVPAWDGQTDAIERVIASRVRLGHSDDSQRESLKILVGATHDINKALDLERVAIDLAAYSHKSLEEASTALIKVEGGQYKALKALGVQLPKNATAEQALAAAQKLVAGAGEAEANTDNGKLKAAQLALGERVEKLGYTLLPLVTDAMLAVADAAGPVVDALIGIVEAAKDADAFVKSLAVSEHAAGEETDLLGSKTTPLGGLLHLLADEISGVASEARNAGPPVGDLGKYVVGAGDLIDSAGGLIVKAFGKVGTKAGTTAITVGQALDDIVSDFNDAKSALEAAASGAADAMFDPIEARAELNLNELEQKRQRNLRDSKDSNAEEKQDAIDKLVELNDAKVKLLADLAAYGDSASAIALANWIAMQRQIKGITAYQIARLDELDAALRKTLLKIAMLNQTMPHGVGDPGYGRASGGPVTAGHAYLVNENTPNSELWVPEVSGHVLGPSATAAVAASGHSGGGGHTFQIYNPEPRAAEDDIGRMLRRAAALGI